MKNRSFNPFKLLVLSAAALAVLSASAAEVGGFELYGYTCGGHSLGGDAQKFRLGIEGDQGIEFGIGMTIDVGDGRKVGANFMPTVAGKRTSNTLFGVQVEAWG